MLNNIMILATAAAAVISVTMGYYVLFRLKSTKREYFLLMNLCIFIIAMGSILEMTAYTASGGLAAVKVYYVGSMFLMPMFLMFVQKYCEIRLPPIVNALIFVIAAAVVLLVWTSDWHTLYYTSYGYNDTSAVRSLNVSPGIIYPFGMAHSYLCLLLILAVLIKKMRVSDGKKKRRIVIIIICAVLPHLSFAFSFINLMPISLMISMAWIYFSLVKHDLLENEETIRSQIWFKDMVANISHDLKTPLTVLGASLQTLSKHTETRGSPEYRRGVRIAYQKTMDLQRLTQNLFEASRIETGKNFYAPKQESLHRLLAQAESKYNAYLDDNGITLDIVAGDDAGISIDPMKIWSVFDNIIYNAARYTEPGGAITITAAADAGSATVTITDTGCGIAEECLPRIFERFYKVSRGRGAKDGDGGLGLYIVKSIMDGCGGKVRAESTPGKGTSIILTFPGTYRPGTEAG